MPAGRLREKGPARTFLFLALLVGWILPGLVGHDPWKPDEAYTFGLVHHIVKTGDWVVPDLAGEPFMEKPPLYFVTAAVTAKLFSRWLPLHDGARLATALYMALVFLFTGLAANELWGKGHGWVAAAILMGCPGLVINAHKLVTDVALLAGFAAALYGFSLARRRPVAGGIALGAGIGIGFLSKGLLAPGIATVTILLLLCFPEWRTKRFGLALAVAFLVGSPWIFIWPLALFHRSPRLFDEWLWINNFGRFFGHVRLGPPKTPGFYPVTLSYLSFPALPVAAWSLRKPLRSTGRVEGSARLPLAAFLAMFAVLAVAAEARELYALPMLVPLSLLAAPAVFDLPRPRAEVVERIGTAAFGMAVFLLVDGWGAMVAGRPLVVSGTLHRLQPGYVPSVRGWPEAAAAACLAAWLLALVRLPRFPGRSVLTWAAGAATVWALAMTLWLPWLDAGMSYRPMIESIRRTLPEHPGEIASAGLGEPQRALLDYFADIRTERIERGATLEGKDFFLVQGTPRRTAEPGLGWREIWEGNRQGDRKELFRLFERVRDPAKNAGRPDSGTIGAAGRGGAADTLSQRQKGLTVAG